MQEIRETVKTEELNHGHKAVGVTAVVLTSNTNKLVKGLLIRAPGDEDPTPNTNVVWVGTKKVTADSNEGTGGMPLPPGESITLPVDDPSKVYVISDAASQEVAWTGV
jgi:hypothetical protein